MHKVIVEEPRHGGRTKYGRRKGQPWDLLPTKEGMRRPHAHRKWFGEHLGPLKRWLRSKVGEYWNDIYSEACSVIKPNDVVRLHIRTHMMDYVERHTYMRDGEAWYMARWGCRGDCEQPVAALRSSTCGPRFYVHPKTGILHEATQWKKDRRDANRARFDAVLKWVSDDVAVVKIAGAWFECSMRALRQSPEAPPFDRVLKLRISDVHAYQIYGRWVYCEAKRQLSSAEVKKLGLSKGGIPHGIVEVIGPAFFRNLQNNNSNSVRRPFSDHVHVLKSVSALTFFDGSMISGYRS